MHKIYESTMQAIDQELVRQETFSARKLESAEQGYEHISKELELLWHGINKDIPPAALYERAKKVAAISIKFMQQCCKDKMK